MSGLLDKANASKTESEPTQVTVVAEKVTIVSQQPTAPALSSASSGGPDTPLKLTIAGWITIFIGGLLALQGGGMGILVVLGVLVVGTGLLVQSERMADREMNTVKLGISIFIAILVAAGPYAAFYLVPADTSMALTEINLNEESDELTFYVRGSFDSATASITLDGESLWSDSLQLNNDRAKFKVPLTAFFAGNAQDYRLASMNEYMIEVSSGDGQSKTAEVTPALLNREVLNSGARISEVLRTQTSGGGSQATTTTTVEGVIVESIMGLFGPSESAQDNGEHSMTNLALTPVASDYTVQLRVKKGSSTEYSSPLIEVNGLDATWTSTVDGAKSGKTNGWLGLPGTAMDNWAGGSGATEFLDKDSFYDGAGCYTFEIVITNVFYAGMNDVDSDATGITVSSNSWELNFDGNTEQRTMEVC
ncbi:hypothetical protein N9L41_02800 [Euryarchaeota archaeon]|nr:hypothetical protein [Euryarchaeota archaeon]MDA8588415.1 hypothetical protein [Euryarchaeota archaeon]MDA8700889.1 hypothetical protein [Euryarchaeota archaeon]MDC3236454.1 hypothetical protein [Candidatus Poseidoniaceae archaeon]MDC3267840.1 hypothetical protein [bacterium]